MSLEQAAAVAGIVGSVGPIVIQAIPTVRKWLFNPGPTPLARAALAGLGGLFGAGIAFLAVEFVFPPIADASITSGASSSAQAVPNNKLVWQADAKCKADERVISVYCGVSHGSAGQLTMAGVTVDKVGRCIWQEVNLPDAFSGSATPLCLKVRSW